MSKRRSKGKKAVSAITKSPFHAKICFVESASQGLSTRSQHFHFYYTSSGLEWKILLIHFVISS